MVLYMLKTDCLKVNHIFPEKELIREAAQAIKRGGLVAFPTETVYGLGVDGFNRDAVLGVYRAKGRDFAKPLTLHVSSLEQARELVSTWPQAAELLAREFLPGPLTLILPRSKKVPDLITAGLPNVGLRFPNNRIALELIKASGVPLAAPSANLSGSPSPTDAKAVLADLEGKIHLVLDGGPTDVGVESTIVSLADQEPQILRLGGISKEKIESILGQEIHLSCGNTRKSLVE